MRPELLEKLESTVRAARYIEIAAADLHGEPDGELRAAFAPFALALSYRLVSEESEGRRADAGGPFEPVGWPAETPPLSDVGPAIHVAWIQVVECATEPRLVARLADLLWESRVEDQPYQRACQAIDAYLAVAARETDDLEDAYAAVRALELSARIGDADRLAVASGAAVGKTRRKCESAEPSLGAVCTLLRGLVELRKERRPAEVGPLIEEALAAFPSDPFAGESLLDLKAALLGAAQRPVRFEQVQIWKDAADAAREEGDQLQRVHRLEHAHDLAVRHGLSASAQGLAVELQGIDPDDLALETISESITITDEQMDRMLAPFRNQSDWQAALNLFGSLDPPGGSEADIDAALEEERRVAPLQAIFGKTIIGSQSAASIIRPVDDAGRLALDRAQKRSFYASTHGAILYTAFLGCLPEQFGTPTRQQLTEHFASDLIAPDLAERIGRSLELYWTGDFDESAHVLVPRLEAVLRELARRAGIRIITLPNGTRAGGVRSLGELLADLKPAFPGAWGSYLQNLLVDQNGGLNLRNNLAHGLWTRFDASHTALLIQVVCFLRLLKVNEAGARPSQSG